MPRDELEQRIDALESVLIGWIAVAGCVATALGLTLQLYQEGSDEPESARIIGLAFEAFADGDAAAIAFGVGFLGLTAAQLGCMVLFLVAGSRSGSPGTLLAFRLCAGLSAVGSLVPVLFWLTVLGDGGFEDTGPAIVPLLIGVVLAIYVCAGDRVIDIWLRRRS